MSPSTSTASVSERARACLRQRLPLSLRVPLRLPAYAFVSASVVGISEDADCVESGSTEEQETVANKTNNVSRRATSITFYLFQWYWYVTQTILRRSTKERRP